MGTLVERDDYLQRIDFHLIQSCRAALELFDASFTLSIASSLLTCTLPIDVQELLDHRGLEVVLLLVKACELLAILLTLDGQVLLEGLERGHEDAESFGKQADQVDLVELIDDQSAVEAHATRAIKEAAGTAKHAWLELQTLEHLAQLYHEFDGQESSRNVRLALDQLHDVVLDGLIVLVQANGATVLRILKDIEATTTAILIALRGVAVTLWNTKNKLDDLPIVVHDQLVNDFERGVIDVAGHDRILQVLEPVVDVDALFDVDQAVG